MDDIFDVIDISKKNIIDNYTPCRISECFGDFDEVIEITNFKGIFRLKNVGRQIWLMLNGRNTISEIVDSVFEQMNIKDRNEVRKHVIKLIKNLSEKKMIIVNWNPLYKLEISQVIEE
ncbi:PqqD family protein [Clostridium hydrogenum]|uniref:PqqD family protein n=1 Tax=Clostridium hydrogenum TaxID=2855764 RepID=UPI001F3C5F7E|nr:PqqD family protein [Clostridium hydrogenum]